MKHGYYDGSKGVTIDLIFGKMDDNIAIITRIMVAQKFRGNGYASEVMQRVLEDADEEGVMLILAVESDGTGLNNTQLSEWYERMGFKWMKNGERYFSEQPETVDIETLVMLRKPRT